MVWDMKGQKTQFMLESIIITAHRLVLCGLGKVSSPRAKKAGIAILPNSVAFSLQCLFFSLLHNRLVIFSKNYCIPSSTRTRGPGAPHSVDGGRDGGVRGAVLVRRFLPALFGRSRKAIRTRHAMHAFYGRSGVASWWDSRCSSSAGLHPWPTTCDPGG